MLARPVDSKSPAVRKLGILGDSVSPSGILLVIASDAVAGDALDPAVDWGNAAQEYLERVQPDLFLQGDLRVGWVIVSDVRRELARGGVPERVRNAWSPPTIHNDAIEAIREWAGITAEDIGTGRTIEVDNAMIRGINNLIHGFVPDAFRACGQKTVPRDAGCNFTVQVHNAYSIIQGYGCTPVKAWVDEADRNTA